MFISIPMLILILVVLAYLYPQTEADKLIEEMRDPGGLKRQAAVDAARADKAARKAARSQSGAIVTGLLIASALLGGAYLIWGASALIWIVWMIVGPFVVLGGMLAWKKLLCNLPGPRFYLAVSALALIPLIISGIQCLITVLKNS